MEGSQRRKFAVDVAAKFGAQALTALRSIIFLGLLGRGLGTANYGIFTQVLLTVALMVPISSLRLGTGLVRHMAGEEDPSRRASLYWSSAAMAALATSIIALTMAWITYLVPSWVFGDPEYRTIAFQVGLLILSYGAFAYAHNYFRAVNQVTRQSTILALGTLTELAAVGLAVSWFDADVGLALITSAVVYLCWSLLTFGLVLRATGSPRLGTEGMRKMLVYSLPLLPNGIVHWVINYSDRLVISHELGLESVGRYSASYSFGRGINMIVIPLGFVLFPMLAQFWDRGEEGRVRSAYSRIYRFYFLGAFPAAVAVAGLSQPVLRVLAGAEFDTSSSLVLWINLGFFFNGLWQLAVYSFHLLHKTAIITAILVPTALLNVTLNLALVPAIGLQGAAAATAISYGMLATVALWFSRRHLGVGLEPSMVARVVLCAVPVWFFTTKIGVTSAFGVFLALAASALIFIAGALLTGVLRSSEVSAVFATVARRPVDSR